MLCCLLRLLTNAALAKTVNFVSLLLGIGIDVSYNLRGCPCNFSEILRIECATTDSDSNNWIAFANAHAVL